MYVPHDGIIINGIAAYIAELEREMDKLKFVF